MTTEVCTDGSFAGVIFSIGPPMRPLIKRPPHYLFETLRRWAANYADCILKGERPVDLPVQVPPWSAEESDACFVVKDSEFAD